MNVLLIDAENLNGESFVFEAYRHVERAYGPVKMCAAFGAKLHLQYLDKADRLLGISRIETEFAIKNRADQALIRHAKALTNQPQKPKLIAIASGDKDFLDTALWLRHKGVATACLSRANIMTKLAVSCYDSCYPMDRKRMAMPSPHHRMTAILDCLHELPAGEKIELNEAVRRMRKWRIAAKSTAGINALTEVMDEFDVFEDQGRQWLRLKATTTSQRPGGRKDQGNHFRRCIDR